MTPPSDVMPPSEYLADLAAERLDVFLTRRLPGLSRVGARRLIETGLVRVDGEVERPSYRLRFGEMVRVWPASTRESVAQAEDIPLDVLYEDADVIVLNKPVGLTVHPAPGQSTGTLVNALLAHCPDLGTIGDAIRPGLVHRLDRDTSGVMMVAKHQVALVDLQEQVRTRTVEKRYSAVVAGTPDPLEGRVDAPIGRDPGDPKRMAVVERGRPSQTEYRVTERFVDSALLDCRLITGRTHQIRVHLRRSGIRSWGTTCTGNGRCGSTGRRCTRGCWASGIRGRGRRCASRRRCRRISRRCWRGCGSGRRCMDRTWACLIP